MAKAAPESGGGQELQDLTMAAYAYSPAAGLNKVKDWQFFKNFLHGCQGAPEQENFKATKNWRHVVLAELNSTKIWNKSLLVAS